MSVEQLGGMTYAAILSRTPTPLPVPRIDLSDIGKNRCEYILGVAKQAYKLIDRLQAKMATYTSASFVEAYKSQDPEHEETIAYIALKYESIFENMLRLRLSWELFWKTLLPHFPVVQDWSLGKDAVRKPRNAVAHGYEVKRPYWDDCREDIAELKFAKFDAEVQWDTMQSELPPLYTELKKLIAIFENELPNMTEGNDTPTPGPSLIFEASSELRVFAKLLAKKSKDPKFRYLHAKAKTGLGVKKMNSRIGARGNLGSWWLTKANIWEEEMLKYAEKKMERRCDRDAPPKWIPDADDTGEVRGNWQNEDEIEVIATELRTNLR